MFSSGSLLMLFNTRCWHDVCLHCDTFAVNSIVGELYFRVDRLRSLSGQSQTLAGFEKIRTVGKGDQSCIYVINNLRCYSIFHFGLLTGLCCVCIHAGAYGTAVLYRKKDDDSRVILKEINLHDLNASERQLTINEV